MSGPTVDCLWPVAAMLGEGPMWDVRAQCLWFVDIKQGRLHRFDPASGARETIACGRNPGFVLPAAPGGLVIGDRDTLHHRRQDGTITPLVTVPIAATDRFNDATVDARGRIWFGSMDDEESEQTGRVHVYDRGAVHVAGGAAIITNGPAIGGGGRWLYHVDSAKRTIWRFDMHNGDTLAAGEVFVRIDAADGAPDGVTIDAEDHVWVGLWGGWATRRYAPDGRLVQQVALPCANVTKVAFGAADLRTAYVTTARIGLDAAALAEQPQAGGLFAFATEVPGVPLTPVALP